MENTDLTGPFRPAVLSWPALLTGAAVGALVALETVLTHASLTSRLFGSSLREVSYLFSAVTLLIALLAASCVILRDRVWRHRAAVVVGLVMLTSHLTAISAGPLNPLVVAILFAVGVWLLDLLAGNGSLTPSVFRTLAILFFTCVLGSAFGAHPTEVLRGIVLFLPKLVLAIVIVALIDDAATLRFAVNALLWAAGVIALAALAILALYYFFQLDFSLAEEDYKFAATPFGFLLRATGFSRTANQFAPPIAVACVMSAFLACALPGLRRRLGFALLALLTGAAVGSSIVRGAWAAVLAGLILIPFVARPRLAPLWFALAFIVAFAALASGLAVLAIDSLAALGDSSSVGQRMDLLGAGLKAMFESVNGTGIDNFGPRSPTFERYPVHNAPLQAGSELGLPGLLVFLALLAWIAWRLWDAVRHNANVEDRTRMTALLIGYVVLIVAVQGEPMAYSQFLWIYLGLGEAAAKVANQQRFSND
jgi:O-antigen ligase